MRKIIILLIILFLQCAGPLHVVIVERTGNCEMDYNRSTPTLIVKEGGSVTITPDTVLSMESIPGGCILYDEEEGKFYPDSVYSVFKRKKINP